MRRFWQKIMSHLEMRNFEHQYEPDETEMSAQERLLYNNNYNSNNHHNNTSNIISTNDSGGANSGSSVNSSNQHLPNVAMTSLDDGENHYQLPYAHLHPQQSPYLPHHHNHLVQPPPPHLLQQQYHHPHGSYSSGDDHSSTYGAGARPPINGHGGCSMGIYPHAYPGQFGTLQDKYSVAAYPVRAETDGMMGRRGNRATGSGIVYRPRRKLWWAVIMLALALLVIAGAVVIAVYFTVLAKDNEPAEVLDSGESGARDGHDSGGAVSGDFVTRQPPYNIPGTSKTPPDARNNVNNDGRIQPGTQHSKVTRFEAFWHPGDSRIFTALLANGTTIEVFGPKKSDGTIKSIYSLGLKNGKPGEPSSTSFIRFQGGRNIASVVLPNGVVVNYDWSADKQHLEVKVFEPYTRQTTGPISYLAKVASSLQLYPLRQLHDVLERLPLLSAVSSSGGRARYSTKCFSRFPVMVNKCGGKFPYDGAYVQGEISGLGNPIRMAALPWPKESSDPCYHQDAGSAYNFYLPLPGVVDEENATMIKEAYVASSAKIFYSVCDLVHDQHHAERQKVCSNVAEKVRAELNAHHLLDSVYTSCSAIMNAVFTMCFAVHDIASNENMPSVTENVLLRSFQRRISNSFPSDLPESVDIKAHAFCPSSPPQSSYQSPVRTGNIRGNVVADAIRINCGNYPEITYVDMQHMLALNGQQFDLIKHKIRMCSICAFEMEASAQIVKEEMMCNNTCTKTSSMGVKQGPFPAESTTFDTQDSVYCTDFLSTIENRIGEPIGRNCLANCWSDLKVQIQIKDPKTNVLFYDQAVKCSELKKSRCTMKFGK
ncbi:hypothetical protein ElyMa_003980400 [Elysia marginata]|uniref:Uncharacterized protein n=1 Tax=Elysia marginata TaxID=1093978 RepID=A0AAV4FYX8_9GAST|nr:hypothetical protein ElyMa_003980400 [Elysia marginata]